MKRALAEVLLSIIPASRHSGAGVVRYIPTTSASWHRIRAAAALFSVLLLLTLSPSLANQQPRRIVSLNLCTDQLLFDLVPRDRIAGLSWLAGDRNVSAIADEIGGITLLRGTAEEVLTLNPDLVLAGAYTTVATVDLLRRVGRRVEVIEIADDIEGVRRTIRRVATVAGVSDRGEAMISAFDRELAAIAPPPPGQRLTALAYQVNGHVSGPGSLLDAVLNRAGFANKARDHRLGRAGNIALEMLITNPPDLLIFAHDPGIYRTVVAENLRHPALQRLLAERAHLVLDMPTWLCGTPRVATAAAALAAARARIGATRTAR